MDTNRGLFLEQDDDRVRDWMERLSVGEIVKVKGEELKVISFGDDGRTVTLQLLSAQDRLEDELQAVGRLSAVRDELNKRPWMTPTPRRAK